MRIWPIAWKSLLFCILLVPLTAFSETESELERFEKDATRPQKAEKAEKADKPSRRSHSRETEARDTSGSIENELEDELVSMVVDMVYYVVSTPGVYSWQRVTPYTEDDTSDEDPAPTPRTLGEGLIPFARLDVSYNRINSDIYAISERAEVGYGPFGFEVRSAHYSEKEPGASLDTLQYHVLYRMSFSDSFEMDLGFGSYELSGMSQNSGASSTVHILVYPSERFGLEYRPSWATINGNSISDDELSVNYGDKYWSARAGYHWLESPASSLNGPFIGFSLRY